MGTLLILAGLAVAFRTALRPERRGDDLLIAGYAGTTYPPLSPEEDPA